MKNEEIFLDLSKCTEEEKENVENLTGYMPKNKDFVLMFYYGEWDATTPYHAENIWIRGRTEITYPEFIKLLEGGESKEVLQLENNEWIKSIAISHQKQMSSTHPHAIIGTIEDAIIEALEKLNSNQ